MRTRDFSIRRDNPAAEGERAARVDNVVLAALREGVKLETLWIVTEPTLHSTIGDICFETTAEGLALQVLGGLKPAQILGVFTGEAAAATFAGEQFAAVAARLYAEAEKLRLAAMEMGKRAALENPARGRDFDTRD